MKTATSPTSRLYCRPQGFDALAGVKEIVGRNIQRLIDATPGMTREQLATALKTGHSNVSRWIRGTTLPTAENIDAMAALFNVSVTELFNESLVDPKRPMSSDEILKLFAASKGYTLKRTKK